MTEECLHCWNKSNGIAICILCRHIVNYVEMKQMSQEEFEKLYPHPGEISPIIFNDAPEFNPKKTPGK